MNENDLPYGPETVTTACDVCGEQTQTHEDCAEDDDVLVRCESCDEDYWRDRLTRAALGGEDETFGRARAVLHLKMDFGEEAFPIHDIENDRWLVDAEQDTLDGTRFLSKQVWVTDGNDPCPDCGNERRREAWGTNGIVDWWRDECTICEHVFGEDAG